MCWMCHPLWLLCVLAVEIIKMHTLGWTSLKARSYDFVAVSNTHVSAMETMETSLSMTLFIHNASKNLFSCQWVTKTFFVVVPMIHFHQFVITYLVRGLCWPPPRFHDRSDRVRVRERERVLRLTDLL